jgi:UDP-N-acetylmuramoyl-tripeptide--D-alanyl-D-alanine ligase
MGDLGLEKVIILGTYLVFTAFVGVKWIRVAQREHYVFGWTERIAAGWGKSRPASLAPLLVSVLIGSALLVLGAYELVFEPVSALLAALAVGFAALWPWGLGFRGTTSKLQWTARAKRLAAIWFVVWVLSSIAGIALFAATLSATVFGVPLGGPEAAPITAWLAGAFVVIALVAPARFAPISMDIALAIANPIEKALSKKWLVAAQKKLRQVNPTVVAVTGSYGKTSTKGYIAHLVGTKYSVVPSPASFNNLMGLARAVNDKLTPGTEVFVAEMGIFGEGEIRRLCESFPPDIAAITVIGEAHLERMKTRETILRAKSEIVDKAKTVVLPIDDPDLARLADRCESEGKRVMRVSATGATADVSVNPSASTATIGGESVPVTISGVGHAVNVAVALGIAHALDVPLSTMAPRLSSLPTAAHRADPQQAPSGAIIIDDSYNANPSGAARAVEGGSAMAKERGGAFIVVTPGMIELGPVQAERNRAFAEQIANVGGELFVVGHTNRKALVSGHPSAKVFAKRTDAMSDALQRAGAKGVILVENDLPDHYA